MESAHISFLIPASDKKIKPDLHLPIPDPYKTYMAAGFSRTGKKSNNAMYYLHVEPGNKRYGSRCGDFRWMPAVNCSWIWGAANGN